MKDFFKKFAYTSCFVIGIGIGLSAIPLYRIVTSLIGGRHLQTLYAKDLTHKASLYKKHNLADINFVVRVDGQRVYFSPDYVPYADYLYRETLLWDETGRVVILELMGKRVFVYDAEEKRELKKGEINNYQFYPIPSGGNYAPLEDIEEKEEKLKTQTSN